MRAIPGNSVLLTSNGRQRGKNRVGLKRDRQRRCLVDPPPILLYARLQLAAQAGERRVPPRGCFRTEGLHVDQNFHCRVDPRGVQVR